MGKSTISERISELITQSRLSTKQFADAIGVLQQTLFNYTNGREPSYQVIAKILASNPNISAEWLITGMGSMFKDSKPSNMFGSIQGDKNVIGNKIGGNVEFGNNINVTLPESGTQKIVNPDGSVELAATNPNSVNYKLVPLLNLDAVGGLHSLNDVSDNPEYTEKLIPFTDAQDGDIALIVSGNSMDPTCPAGSKVLLREVKSWQEYFGFGNIFVLLLNDGRRILKEVQKYPEDSKNYILCKSHNDKYPEEELPKKMISSVWKVVKILNERGW